MAKSVVNPQFRAISTAHYAIAKLLPRAKGQRKGPCMDQHVGQMLYSECMLPAGWRLVLLGVGPGYGEHGQVINYDHLAVHAPCGTVYPAYRRSSPCNSYTVCQNLQYVVRKG
jgi:hypothetical protein